MADRIYRSLLSDVSVASTRVCVCVWKDDLVAIDAIDTNCPPSGRG